MKSGNPGNLLIRGMPTGIHTVDLENPGSDSQPSVVAQPAHSKRKGRYLKAPACIALVSLSTNPHKPYPQC